MKHKLFRFFLKLIGGMTAQIQLGNPLKKAPRLINDPLGTEKIIGPNTGTNDIHVWQLKNVLCSGLYSGAVINSQNQVYERFITFPWGKEVHPVRTSPYLGRKVKTIEKGIFLITTAAKGNYYHWIVDLLPRLLLILELGLPDLEDRFIILHSPGTKYEESTFKLLGIKEEKIIRLKPFEFVEVSDLIIADFVLSYERTPFLNWKKQLLDQFKNNVLQSGVKNLDYKKIYLLRGKQSKRQLIGEERLVEVLSRIGFDIIDPQKLTLAEQIAILSGAEVVVAAHGAALTNTIFCKGKTCIIEFRSKNRPPEFFSEIAKTYNLNFDTISLPPQNTKEKSHIANKENLILTNESIDLLMEKLHNFSSACY